ncbi:MAG TPA: tetratricopeptide repeat protein [Acidobacteriota bacterium]|jgi:tetratricopeptide (TPR) repeat protein
MNNEELYQKGMEAFAEDQYDKAIEFLLQATQQDPTFSDAFQALAMAHYHRGDLDRSIQAARRLTELQPDNILAWTSLSMAYQQKGMISEAEAAGEKAKELGLKETFRIKPKES